MISTGWLEEAVDDFRFGIRLLSKNRAFTIAAVVALGLGIGISNTVYTIVNAMVLRGLPVANPDRVVAFNDEQRGFVVSISYRDLEDWRAARSFAGLAAYNHVPMTIGDEGRSPEVFYGAYISGDTFRLLGERPMLGRDFRPDEDGPGSSSVVLLGHRVWMTRYGGDAAVIGQTVRINGTSATVIGVMGEGVRFPLVNDLWQPLRQMPGLNTERRDARVLMAFGILAKGVTLAQARAELDTVAGRLSREFPDTNKTLQPVVVPFTGTLDHPMFLALFGAVTFVLLIACANVANLLLARSAHRHREISLRLTLGATRWRVFRQLFVESFVLAMIAGVVGLGLSVLGVKLYANAVSGIPFAYWSDGQWTMDSRVLTFILAVSVSTVFVFGLVPALRLSKASVGESLKDGSRTSTSGIGLRRWTNTLLAIELAFTLILLAGASLMMRSFLAEYRADQVIDASRILMASVRFSPTQYPNPEQRSAFLDRFEERLGAISTIESATFANVVPFGGAPMWRLAVDGHPSVPENERPMVSFVSIGPRYFDTLGLPIVRGRPFTERDGTAGYETAIVSQRFVAVHFPNDDPIGQRILLTDPSSPDEGALRATIVGVSQTIRQQGLSDIDPVVYVPQRGRPNRFLVLMIRSSTNFASLTAAVREELRALDPEMALNRVAPLSEVMTQSRWAHRVFGTMFTVFASIALVLGALGLYAVTAYSVTQRTREIGLRVALGARPAQVIWLIVKRSFAPLTVGLALGLAGTLGAGRLIQTMLVQTTPNEPVVLISTAALLVLVALSACYWPARRATRLDPVAALRHE